MQEKLICLEKLIGIVAKLRNPDSGCPWDLQQTHQSLKPYLLEEAYELLEAIDALALIAPDAAPDDAHHILHFKEELGDVLLQVLLHAQIAQDRGWFDIGDVAEVLGEKLIRRHPHVFGDAKIKDAEAQIQNWAAIKAAERKSQAEPTMEKSILGDIAGYLPALSLAAKMSRRAVQEGFAWPSDESLWECVMSEFEEFRRETAQDSPGNFSRLEDEMGDILFATVSLAGRYGIDPETALIRGVQKFKRRFQMMEAIAEGQFPKRLLKSLTFEEWEQLWSAAKSAL